MILQKSSIKLNVGPLSQKEAIEIAGSILVEGGYVTKDYISGMFEREETHSTYIGNGVAIPHGTLQSSDTILNTGIAILQSREGIDYGGQTAYLVIGIAAINGEHLGILSKIAKTISKEENVLKLRKALTVDEVYKLLNI